MDNKEVITFRDKIGIAMTTLGVISIFLSIFIFVSWLFMPPESRVQINVVKLLIIFVSAGVGLIRISLFTLKK